MALYCRLDVSVVPIIKMFLISVCRLQQFVDMAVTQHGLEFRLARSMAILSFFRGRRKCLQYQQRKPQNLDHIR